MIPANELSKMFYALESSGYAPITRIRIDLQGASVDIELLRRAYLLAAKKFPVLNATLHDRSSWHTWQLYWILRRDIYPEQAIRVADLVMLSPREAEARLEKIQFDPFSHHRSSKDPPFWMVLCRLPGGSSRLMAFFHHAVTDGYGYDVILRYIFEAYNRLKENKLPGPVSPVTPGYEPASLLPSSPLSKIKAFLQAISLLLVKAVAQRGREPEQLLHARGPLTARTAAVQRAIGPEKLQHYIAAARKIGTTLTGFFAAAQTIALQRWKQAHGESCGLISVQLLKDLRQPEQSSKGLQNNFFAFSIPIPENQRNSPADLARFFNRQIRRAVTSRTAEKLTGLLWLLNLTVVKKLLPLWGNPVFNNPGLGDSFQVSNTGRLWAGPDGAAELTSLGDSEITAFFMASGPPVPTMGTYTGLCTFGESLFVSFNYFTWALSSRDAGDFVDLVEQTLDEMVGESSAHPQRQCWKVWI